MSVRIDHDFELARGQLLSSIDEAALTLQGPTWRSLVINGEIQTSTATAQFPLAAVAAYGDAGGGTIIVGDTGAIHFHSTSGQCYSTALLVSSGISKGAFNVANRGTIEATSESDTTAVSLPALGSFENSGSITAVARLNAHGVTMGVGAFHNTGAIDVTAGSAQFTGAIGVRLENTGPAGDFLNSGSIRSHHLDPSAPSVGVLTYGGGRFINTGLIEGDKSIVLWQGVNQPAMKHLFNNSGTLRGDVDFINADGAGVVFTNTGRIEGAIRFGFYDEIYDGRGGFLQGELHAGYGDDSLLGGAYAETLLGEGGNDTIGGGSGEDVLDGGDGIDTLTFYGAASGVRLDLGSQAVSNGASFSHFEKYQGSEFADTIVGSTGADTVDGSAGDDVVYGGQGDDLIVDTSGSNYLRGDEGDDSISGGSGFDDINGNMGNDTAHGNDGGDWVVGGKDNDLLYGDAGDDIVYGNLGSDTCMGGAGADLVRGGKENDVVDGGDGDDWLSGDKGDDTITGGAGADVFHTFGDAGLDRVTDFNRAQGDRVQLDPGTSYAVSQHGEDVVIDMVGGGQMVLVGVQMSTLTGDWIFGA